MITDEGVRKAVDVFESAPSDANDYAAMRAALEAVEPMLRAPDVITKAMYDAARDWSCNKYGKPIGNEAAAGCWKAMLAAAAPKPDNEGE